MMKSHLLNLLIFLAATSHTHVCEQDRTEVTIGTGKIKKYKCTTDMPCESTLHYDVCTTDSDVGAQLAGGEDFTLYLNTDCHKTPSGSICVSDGGKCHGTATVENCGRKDDHCFYVKCRNSWFDCDLDIVIYYEYPPTVSPTLQPTKRPTAQPTRAPTSLPTLLPSHSPTLNPTIQPTTLPTILPTLAPTPVLTEPPQGHPSQTEAPTPQVTDLPTLPPSSLPTVLPSQIPTDTPTNKPTIAPTRTPTRLPSAQPTPFATMWPTPEALPVTCHGTVRVTHQSGVITDGSDEHAFYATDLQCLWAISPAGMPSGYQVELHFRKFDSTEGVDTLEIYDGVGPSAGLLGILTGEKSQVELLDVTFTSSNESLLLVWTTKTERLHTGWIVEYDIVHDKCSSLHTITSSEGTFNDGSLQDEAYFPSTYCGWLIQPDVLKPFHSQNGEEEEEDTILWQDEENSPGHEHELMLLQKEKTTPPVSGSELALRIEFISFYTEDCCDHVNIYDGSSRHDLVINLHGKPTDCELSNMVYTSDSGVFFIEFISDESTNYDGWKLKYELVDVNDEFKPNDCTKQLDHSQDDVKPSTEYFLPLILVLIALGVIFLFCICYIWVQNKRRKGEDVPLIGFCCPQDRHFRLEGNSSVQDFEMRRMDLPGPTMVPGLGQPTMVPGEPDPEVESRKENIGMMLTEEDSPPAAPEAMIDTGGITGELHDPLDLSQQKKRKKRFRRLNITL